MVTKPRRGVLLLVVLALLAMFAMVAVAFVVMTGAEKRSADRVRTIEAVVDSPEKTLNQAFNVVVRGSPVIVTSAGTLAATTSAITWQSLLEKIYGYETIGSSGTPATMSSITWVCGQTLNGNPLPPPLIEFNFPQTPPDPSTLSSGTATIDPFHYVGCVVTMLSGSAAGLSSRIVGINPQSTSFSPIRAQILAFDGGIQPAQNDQYIVNGFPYSGMGFGFSSGSLSQLALTPNAPPASWNVVGGTTGIIPGGVNSDYTAADYQDPLLAMAVPNPTSGGVIVPIPSLHRSDLIAHLNATNNVLKNVALLRQVMFRPNSIDHPLFTGSNPHFSPVWDGVTKPYDPIARPNGNCWDVDNDGDGVPDSVWVDLGLPVRYTSDGRAYKPLFAILCLDMDGRLNLNAHGSYAQAQQAYYQNISLPGYRPISPPPPPSGPSPTLDVGIGTTPPTSIGSISSPAANFAGALGSTSPTIVPRGQGTGTAEVNLLPLFLPLVRSSTTSIASPNYQALLSGSGGLMGRYGPTTPSPSVQIGSALPGIDGAFCGNSLFIGSALTLNNAFPYNGVLAGTYWANFALPISTGAPIGHYDACGSPPDPQTFGAIALDRAGRPLYISLGGPVANGPYDIDLTHNAAHAGNATAVANNQNNPPANPPDNPFGVAELERIIRCYDRDTPTLPQRLATLTTLVGSSTGSLLQSRRAEITTESWNVPVASGVLPPTLRAYLNPGTPNAQRSMHPVDILSARLPANVTGNASTLAKLRTQLLPWEILQGRKMDLNRPFGPGAFSSQANGGMITGFAAKPKPPVPCIPDQPGATGENVTQLTRSSGTALATFNYAADGGLSTNSNGSGVSDSFAARQLYARHLYVLALALSDTGAIANDLASQGIAPMGTPPSMAETVAHMLAQWAVNVVAYRDNNGIMIPFPYCPNPFTRSGWTVDNTPLHTVWGCKRPELLISETLAFHDRRTQDLNNEVLDKSKVYVYQQLFGVAIVSRSSAGLTTDKVPKKDPGFNSAFRPQGSLFVELYNPWTVREPRTNDLSAVDPATQIAGVYLNKVTPTVNGQSSPVWRLAIVNPDGLPAPANGDELPDPDDPTVSNRPKFERTAYFVSSAGMTMDKTSSAVFCLSSTNPAAGTSPSNAPPIVVMPSGYAVVGSSNIGLNPTIADLNRTYIGFESGQTAGKYASTPMVTLNSSDLTTADPRVVRSLNNAAPSAPVPRVLGIDYNLSTTSAQRLSVSEPVHGYTQFEVDANGKTATYTAASGQYNETLDIPVDLQRCNPVVSTLYGSKAHPTATTETFKGVSIAKWLNNNGTIPAYRIIYLQRLADPTRPWVAESTNAGTPNPATCNPYRTVDAMTVDLTTFNGLTSSTNDNHTTGLTLAGTVSTTYHFEAHQRGDDNYLYVANQKPSSLGKPGEVNLWKQEPANKSALSPAGWIGGGATPKATCNFTISGKPFTLNQTLGYVNQSYGPPSNSPAGDPQYPFPWLNWSYRPFNNEYELLLVPMLSSSRLLARNTTDARRYFGYVDSYVRGKVNGTSNTGYNPQPVYEPSSPSAAKFVSTPYSARLPYPHLLNFFESGKSSAAAGTAAQLNRLLAYVGVPSRFANTQLQLPPVVAGKTTSPHYFHTPFNRISRYREPGRINLNTVTSSDVLFGALNMYFSPLEMNLRLNPIFWDKFVRSRRGGTATDPSMTPATTSNGSLNNMFGIDPKAPFPSRFMRPYRTPGGASLATLATLATTGGTLSAEPPRETEVTLLRADPDVLTTSNSADRPLFEVDDYLMSPTSKPANGTAVATPTSFTVTSGTNCACLDYNRNPYFRYQALQKLGSVCSNHSNVFAIWITEGYFEVLPNHLNNGQPDAGHPDGWELGPELGSDTGDIVRHRAFYMFDRSIPVGFIRGQDINQDKAVLQKRFIE